MKIETMVPNRQLTFSSFKKTEVFKYYLKTFFCALLMCSIICYIVFSVFWEDPSLRRILTANSFLKFFLKKSKNREKMRHAEVLTHMWTSWKQKQHNLTEKGFLQSSWFRTSFVGIIFQKLQFWGVLST